MTKNRSRRQSRHRRHEARKDRLIQTRVDEDLEQALKREAAKRRLTVSHLIRNTLEDTFELVEDVTNDVGQIVSGSVELAEAIGRDARRFADIVRGRSSEEGESGATERSASDRDDRRDAAPPEPAGAPVQRASEVTPVPDPSAGEVETERREPKPSLEHIYGWNRVVANRPARCAMCGAIIERGDDALVGLSDDPAKPRAWLCVDCEEEL